MENYSEKVFTRNKWTYSLGGIGRDMTYALVATFLMTYIQYAIGLTAAQFASIGIILVAGRVWDAVNDPIMGAIIENTRSRWGKFKPWILAGAVLTAIIVVIMFNFRPSGWNFVIFFVIIYLFWEIAFTMNDISYWSMLPSLATDPKRRNSITTLAVVFAGVGAFAANAAINFLTVNNVLFGYSMISIVIAVFLIGCQVLTVFGVVQPETFDEKKESVTIKKMVKVIKNNDQLLWNVFAMLLYNVGSGLLVALGYNFIFLELGYSNLLTTIFVASFGVSSISVQATYTFLTKRFSRKKLLIYSLLTIITGYLILLLVGFVPFLPMHIITVVLFGVLVFSGQSIFYMVLTVNISNTVEYNEYKTGERNEGVIFSLRPFMAKLASALEQGLQTAVLIISGVFLLSQNITMLENQKFIYERKLVTAEERDEYRENVRAGRVIFDGIEYDEKTAAEKEQYYKYLQMIFFPEGLDGREVTSDTIDIADIANVAFRDQSTTRMRVVLRASITIAPILLIGGSFAVLRKKFIIDEAMYNKMISEIKARKIE